MNHIVKFQADYCLNPDGIIGRNTLSKMREAWNLSKEQLSHVLGQINHETGGFKSDIENLNYSNKRLLAVFPKYFTSESVLNYANDAERIGNKVYSSRMGNGDEASGDGFKFRGRGSLQLTGKRNYFLFEQWLKQRKLWKSNDETLWTKPDLVATHYFWETALFYFVTNNLLITATKVNTETITLISKAVNLGTMRAKGTPNGLLDRISKTKYYFNLQK